MDNIKKIFNNSGMTLIEVIVATLIIGLVAVPIFGSIMETVNFNIKTDVEINMSSAMQETIEKIKAGEINTFPYITYYNRWFKASQTETMQYYCLTAEVENNSSMADNNIDGVDNKNISVAEGMDIKLKIIDLKTGREVISLKTFLRN